MNHPDIPIDPRLPDEIVEDFEKIDESLGGGDFFGLGLDGDNSAIDNDGSNDGQLPPLIVFEFPPGFYEKQGRRIIQAVEMKMSKFFGFTNDKELEKIESSDDVIEYLSNTEFNNVVVNYIVKKCISYLKPTDEPPIKDITDKKSCKRSCRKIQTTSISFMQRIFQYFMSQVTREDLRFRIYQNPKKRYDFSFDPEIKQYRCKCVDKEFQLKVSPRLFEIMNNTFSNVDGGPDLAEEILKENADENVDTIGSKFGFMSLGKLALYFSGFSTPVTRDYNDPSEFIRRQFIINVFIFFFCHCFWYIHIVYFILMFFVYYVL